MPLLPLHQAHDYRALMARWRGLAGRLKVKFQTLTEVQGVKVHWLETGHGDEPVIYLSSGVHGDEVGAAWGLLLWAEENEALLLKHRFLIFPCLNPFGLMLNTRADHHGQDLNRRFHIEDDDICGPWRRLMVGRSLGIGLCLHEDYDGQGCYVYELSHHRQALSQDIMANLRTLPPDPRKSIDGSRAVLGVIRRKKVPLRLPGLPEAIVLHQLGCETTLTFETPSEFSLDDRVQAQVEFVNAVLSAAQIL
ncbi:succinylglutamate desuccinylase/aspartoacylase family protein [Prosthecobacter fusiformis]|uniref:Succinylglutamate desuccinylase/aspartoacylase family protein n=1 Tax=Prosthecobacter fusiformis TaxID=48464 RepID=A0A4R7S4Q0_9BACT|nr:M14 family metallocarboxypeptidase [Prosthecobacter fusiformis]TDU72829.1 succinylglutamate desuccinylase/aspartoacylase family protein [Prosthecobacter fusiformis]